MVLAVTTAAVDKRQGPKNISNSNEDNGQSRKSKKSPDYTGFVNLRASEQGKLTLEN